MILETIPLLFRLDDDEDDDDDDDDDNDDDDLIQFQVGLLSSQSI